MANKKGKIIDESALIHSLKSRKISNVILDVFSNTQLSDRDSPLFDLDNVFLSLHISGNFPEYQRDVVVQFADN